LEIIKIIFAQPSVSNTCLHNGKGANDGSGVVNLQLNEDESGGFAAAGGKR
jgi:hypothetical protein